MRVLHVAPAALHGGTSGFTQRQIDRLAEAGIDGRTVYVAGSAMVSRPQAVFKAIGTVRRQIRDFRPHLVHAHWGSLLALVSAIASVGGPPLLISYRGSDINPVPSETVFRSLVRVGCSQAAALGAEAIICMSDELRRRLWTGAGRAVVIVDGVDLMRFVPRDRHESRRLLGWDSEERTVLFNAGGRPQVKRLDLAEAGVAEARRRVGHIRLEVMQGHVPHDDVPLLISAADCVLMTSDFEGSPNIVREALACDTAVVSVPVGDVSRWLDGSSAARIVDRDPVKLGAAIAEVLTARARPQIGARVNAFSDIASRDAICEMYRRVIGVVNRRQITSPSSAG